MKKVKKYVGYILFFLLFIYVTVVVQFGWFEWFRADDWTVGLIIAVCLSIGSVALSVFAGIRAVRRKSFWLSIVLLVVYLLMTIFFDRIDCFFYDLIGKVVNGDISRKEAMI